MKKLLLKRGFTDRLYFYNFAAVHMLMVAILTITALSGALGVTDLSPFSNITQYAYMELGLHTGFIVWKAKEENSRKYRFGTDKNKKVAPVQPEEMEEEEL